MQILAIDYGMGYTKYAYLTKGTKGKSASTTNKVVTKCFESRLKIGEGSTFQETIINGSPITFGEGSLACEYGHLTKENDIHRYLMYKAMYQCHVETGETEFRLCVACSLASWKHDKGERVKQMMFQCKEVNWNNEITFKIEDVIVYPETLIGSLTSKINLVENDVIAIDFGTRNLQLLRILQGAPQIATAEPTELGMETIYKGLANLVKVDNPAFRDSFAIKKYLQNTAKYHELLSKCAVDIEDKEKRKELEEAAKKELEKAIKNRTAEKPNEKLDKVINQYLLESVFIKIESLSNEMGATPYTEKIFLGGGSAYLKRFIEEYYIENDRINFLDDVFYANAKGLLGKALAVYKVKDSKAKTKVKTKAKVEA